MRRLLTPVVVVLGALLLTSCTVPQGALSGVGVDSSGKLVGYLHVCHDSIDGATLYYDTSSTRATASTSRAGSWVAAAPVTGTASWSLTSPAIAWTAVTPLEPLAQQREYTLYGWTNDNTSSAAEVTFTLAEVSNLAPGEVLHWSGRSGGSPERGLNEVSTLADFESKACKIVGP